MTSIERSVDVAVQAMAGIGCPVWAPIKAVLKISEDYGVAAEQILGVVEMMSENLPRLEIYAKLRLHPVLQIAMLNVFTDVIEFSIKAYKFFQRNAAVRLLGAMWRPFKQEFGGLIARLERHTKCVDDTAIALEQAEAATYRTEMRANHQEQLKISCFQRLQPLDMRKLHQERLNQRVNGTCEWILSNETFARWDTSTSATAMERILLVAGPAGSGKSILSSFIWEQFKTQKQQTIYFSFADDDTAKQTSLSMVRTLIWQLLEQNGDDKFLRLISKLLAQGPPLMPDLLKALSEAINRMPDPVKVIVNGTDECTDSSAELFNYLLELARKNSNVNLCFFGRPHHLHSQAQRNQIPNVISITSATNKKDIQTFIEAELARHRLLNRPTIYEVVSRVLLEKADGMFLWVKLMIEDLGRAATKHEVTERLRDLPQGLEDAYRFILSRLLNRLDKYQLKLVENILSLLSASGRPLRFEEWRYAYALATRSKSDTPGLGLDDFLPELLPEDVADSCGGLITIYDNCIRLVHSSVIEFLIRPADHWKSDTDRLIERFRVDPAVTHDLLASLCLTYLSDESCCALPWQDQDEMARFGEHMFLEYACSYFCYHLNRSNKSPSELHHKILDILDLENCFLVAELLVATVLSDTSLQPHVGLAELAGTMFSGNMLQDILPMLAQRWKREHRIRVSKFGKSDPRTRRWEICQTTLKPFLRKYGTASVINQEEEEGEGEREKEDRLALSSRVLAEEPHDEISELPLSMNQLAANQDLRDIREGFVAKKEACRPSNRRTQKVANESMGPTNNLEGLKALLHNSRPMSLGRQFEFLSKALLPLHKAKELFDPVMVVYQMILQKLAIIPALPLAAIAWSYHQLSKDKEAYRLCLACLEKAGNDNKYLTMELDTLMGSICNHLGKHEEASNHLERAVETAKRSLGEGHFLTLHAQYGLGWHKWRAYWDPSALDLFGELIKHRKTSRRYLSRWFCYAYYYSAEIYWNDYQCRQALKAYEEFLEEYKRAHKNGDCNYWIELAEERIEELRTCDCDKCLESNPRIGHLNTARLSGTGGS
ncbi:hypothetical protein CC78DRAFT_535313 [Lojkania enalia]|uniref:NACHT domain-containing protein n=1 Tax=Lojkania enalia TaxID=147567 RepID=A0A9P4K4C7_9PLEO|nr:hypothetical protein CC78DRAFT_535313 [Didymosphaeria enalia]